MDYDRDLLLGRPIVNYQCNTWMLIQKNDQLPREFGGNAAIGGNFLV